MLGSVSIKWGAIFYSMSLEIRCSDLVSADYLLISGPNLHILFKVAICLKGWSKHISHSLTIKKQKHQSIERTHNFVHLCAL